MSVAASRDELITLAKALGRGNLSEGLSVMGEACPLTPSLDYDPDRGTPLGPGEVLSVIEGSINAPGFTEFWSVLHGARAVRGSGLANFSLIGLPGKVDRVAEVVRQVAVARHKVSGDNVLATHVRIRGTDAAAGAPAIPLDEDTDIDDVADSIEECLRKLDEGSGGVSVEREESYEDFIFDLWLGVMKEG